MASKKQKPYIKIYGIFQKKLASIQKFLIDEVSQKYTLFKNWFQNMQVLQKSVHLFIFKKISHTFKKHIYGYKVHAKKNLFSFLLDDFSQKKDELLKSFKLFFSDQTIRQTSKQLNHKSRRKFQFSNALGLIDTTTQIVVVHRKLLDPKNRPENAWSYEKLRLCVNYAHTYITYGLF